MSYVVYMYVVYVYNIYDIQNINFIIESKNKNEYLKLKQYVQKKNNKIYAKLLMVFFFRF